MLRRRGSLPSGGALVALAAGVGTVVGLRSVAALSVEPARALE